MAIRRLSAALALGGLAAASAAAAQVTVSTQWTYPVETVFVADFAPYNVGQQPDFLAITITNGLGRPQTVKLRVKIQMERPDNVLLFEGTTDPFVISGAVRRITNRDLANDQSDVVIEDFEIGENADDLTEKVAETGRFPSGTYVFEAIVTTAGGVVLGQSQVRQELVNPSRLTLLAPGRTFGDQPELVSTPAPRFQWTADEGLVGGLGSYKIRVVPVGAAASAEEAMQSFASYEGTTTLTSIVYPGSVSAIPLAAGQTYAWQITREVKTSGGTQLIESPIYWFKMSGGSEQTASGGGAQGGGNVGTDVSLDRLNQALGLGTELKGFHPTGGVVVDGVSVSADNLEALLREILAGRVTVRNVTVN